MMKSIFLITLLLTVVFLSCHKGTPAGFWSNFSSHLLLKNITDQGPYGGHRAMYWKADRKNSFRSGNVIDFATKNGWTLVDSIEFTQAQTSKWIYMKTPIFPLTSKGFSDTALNDAMLADFPRWFDGQIKVYRFKTGWVAIEPGTDNSTEENGFVVINKDRNQLAVYHLWGE
jgi:hypothetical protein